MPANTEKRGLHQELQGQQKTRTINSPRALSDSSARPHFYCASPLLPVLNVHRALLFHIGQACIFGSRNPDITDGLSKMFVVLGFACGSYAINSDLMEPRIGEHFGITPVGNTRVMLLLDVSLLNILGGFFVASPNRAVAKMGYDLQHEFLKYQSRLDNQSLSD